MLSQISQPESSWSASRAGVARSWEVRPSFGSPGTSPSADSPHSLDLLPVFLLVQVQRDPWHAPSVSGYEWNF